MLVDLKQPRLASALLPTSLPAATAGDGKEQSFPEPLRLQCFTARGQADVINIRMSERLAARGAERSEACVSSPTTTLC